MVGADILLSLFMAAILCLTLVLGGYKGSWQYLGIEILAYLLKVFGLFKIWRELKAGIVVLAIGALILVAVQWPLFWENLTVKLLLLDFAILIWAFWSFKKVE